MHDRLWKQLLSHLQGRGCLPPRHADLTPAELADKVRADFGDDRPHRFVWGYYYPRQYGGQSGTMEEAEAAALVDSLVQAPPPPSQKPPAPCQLCGSRPIPGGHHA